MFFTGAVRGQEEATKALKGAVETKKANENKFDFTDCFAQIKTTEIVDEELKIVSSGMLKMMKF